MSDVLTDEGVREYLALAPGSDFLNIAGAGHMVAGDRNDMFGKAVLGFLTRPGVLSDSGLAAGVHDALARQLDATDLNDIL